MSKHTPGYKVLRQGPVRHEFAGVIRDGRRVVWECGHSHAMKFQAAACAIQHAARQTVART